MKFCLPIFAYTCISCYNFQIKIKSREKTQEKTIYAPFSADENMYTAVPVHSNVITTNPTTTTTVTSKTISSVSCHTVQSSSCPLNWFAGVTATLAKLPTVSSTSVTESTSENICESTDPQMETAVIHMQTQTPYNLIVSRIAKISISQIIFSLSTMQTIFHKLKQITHKCCLSEIFANLQ